MPPRRLRLATTMHIIRMRHERREPTPGDESKPREVPPTLAMIRDHQHDPPVALREVAEPELSAD